MNIILLIGIAVSLALDAFAVSVTSWVAAKQFRISHALRMGVYFGLFQAVMPLFGWLAGKGLQEFIQGIDQNPFPLQDMGDVLFGAHGPQQRCNDSRPGDHHQGTE